MDTSYTPSRFLVKGTGVDSIVGITSICLVTEGVTSITGINGVIVTVTCIGLACTVTSIRGEQDTVTTEKKIKTPSILNRFLFSKKKERC